MPIVEVRERIDAAPEAVWGLVSDIERAPEWVTVMEALVETTENPVREGTVYTERSKVGPKAGETTWHVTVFDAEGMRQVHECAGRELAAELTMEVVPDGDGGAVLTHRTEFRLLPVVRPVGWVLERLFGRRLMERQLRDTVANAKHILEETPSEADDL